MERTTGEEEVDTWNRCQPFHLSGERREIKGILASLPPLILRDTGELSSGI